MSVTDLLAAFAAPSVVAVLAFGLPYVVRPVFRKRFKRNHVRIASAEAKRANEQGRVALPADRSLHYDLWVKRPMEFVRYAVAAGSIATAFLFGIWPPSDGWANVLGAATWFALGVLGWFGLYVMGVKRERLIPPEHEDVENAAYYVGVVAFVLGLLGFGLAYLV